MESPTTTTTTKRYNLITGEGDKGAPAGFDTGKGRRYYPEKSESPRHSVHIVGPGCVPSPEPAESPRETLKSGKLIPAGARGRQEHLSHQSCIPGPEEGGPKGRRSAGNSPSPRVALRASVDHLAGEACTVRDVVAQPTAEAPPPPIQRGMVTKNMQDRMRAAAANQDMLRSQLYQPGAGYQLGLKQDGTW